MRPFPQLPAARQECTLYTILRARLRRLQLDAPMSPSMRSDAPRTNGAMLLVAHQLTHGEAELMREVKG
jgi:hypothetical protein